jgi:ankyrin repeat protein
MWAAGYGRSDVVKTLLGAGARPDLRDNRGKSALDIAREGGFGETATLLQPHS